MFPEANEYLQFVELDKSKNTLSSYKNAVKKMIEFFHVNSIEDVKKLNATDFRRFQSHLKEIGMSESSINANTRPLRAMFNWMIENEYLEKSPMKNLKRLKTPKRIVAFLNEQEQQDMFSACENITDSVIIALFLTTGLRRDELCKLTLNDYNGTHIRVIGKGDKERSLALQPTVIELLNKYLVYRNSKFGNSTNYLIVSRLGDGFHGGGIFKKVKTIGERAGISEERLQLIHVHTLRHTFVANMLDSGADIFTCQNALGHADIETTMLYAHLHNKTLDNAMVNQKSIFMNKETK